ncbi:MAG: aminopeptidase P family protein [Planctomycetota bacterium]|nr:aminopeptidase P family protein [Planctomycetota bacterium]
MSPVLESIRARLVEEKLDYYWVPSSDEFLNEYVVARAKRLEFLSGFSGSAGNILIGRDSAWLFVDGRYHVQAPQQVDTTLFEVQKIGAPGAVDHVTFLMNNAEAGAGLRVGVDPHCLSLQQFEGLSDGLSRVGAALVAVDQNLVDSHWEQRPKPELGKIQVLPKDVVKESFHDRLETLRDILSSLHCQGTVVQKLDQIAWLLGRRGQDVEFNPVFESLLLVLPETVHLFLHPAHKASFDADVELCIEDLTTWKDRLSRIVEDQSPQFCWYLDPNRLTKGLASYFTKTSRCLGVDLIEQLKSRKNADELAAMRRAGLFASAAKIKAFHWLEQKLKQGISVNEVSFRDHLVDCYSKMPGYQGLSFSVISSVGPNSAICHYSTPNPKATLDEGMFFLVDSGAHYEGGTTDATRAIYIGETPSEQHKRVYTLVLKAHIACARLRFPVGTIGVQLDAITRAPLWNAGADYSHGTGHGVGAWLNVHEGPMGIGMPGRGHTSEQAIEAGQVLSIEPGLYREGWGGVRIENLYQVVADENDELGRENFSFRPLTWIPLSNRLIDPALLTFEEEMWINDYHSEVIDRLTKPTELEAGHELLTESEKAWLSKLCRSI